MFELKKIMTITAVAAVMAVGGGLANEASAATVTVSQGFTGNDCSGFFGQGFGACNIFIDDAGQQIKLSPVIAKYDVDDSEWETNGALYPTITGSEFNFTVGSTGTWSYTQGAGDPSVKYWAAKGSNNFNLFWTVDDTATASGGVCTGSTLYTLACLQEAVAVTTGDWATPIKNGNRTGLSHLTFYNSVPPTVVPLPAAGILLIGALGGLGFAARRRRRAS